MNLSWINLSVRNSNEVSNRFIIVICVNNKLHLMQIKKKSIPSNLQIHIWIEILVTIINKTEFDNPSLINCLLFIHLGAQILVQGSWFKQHSNLTKCAIVLVHVVLEKIYFRRSLYISMINIQALLRRQY